VLNVLWDTRTAPETLSTCRHSKQMDHSLCCLERLSEHVRRNNLFVGPAVEPQFMRGCHNAAHNRRLHTVRFGVRFPPPPDLPCNSPILPRTASHGNNGSVDNGLDAQSRNSH
jgi:hypothetical protein